MTKQHKLHTLFFLLLMIFLPSQVFAYSSKIIPGGQNIGIMLHSKGIMVVGFYKVDDRYLGSDAGLELGDRITKVNGIDTFSIDSMIEQISNSTSNSKVNLTFIRNDETLETELSLIKDNNGVYKTGLFVKDQINGIGTLTYIDPETRVYGALGHEIADRNTLLKVEVKDGKIFSSSVTGIKKSLPGSPGEKTAKYNSDIIYGNIKQNEKSGIFGTYGNDLPPVEAIKVGEKDDVKEGKAVIKTVLKDDLVEEFEIDILHIDSSSDTKNILFEITDQSLLEQTGGVVQGMSGSPIIQDGKIVGAVTHVIVPDSKKGYGIFITTMLEEGEKKGDN